MPSSLSNVSQQEPTRRSQKRGCHILQQNVFRTKERTGSDRKHREGERQPNQAPQGKLSRIELPSAMVGMALEGSDLSSKEGGDRFRQDKSKTTWSKASTRPETIEQEDRLQSLKQEMYFLLYTDMDCSTNSRNITNLVKTFIMCTNFPAFKYHKSLLK
jgi:hypothetical protein